MVDHGREILPLHLREILPLRLADSCGCWYRYRYRWCSRSYRCWCSCLLWLLRRSACSNAHGAKVLPFGSVGHGAEVFPFGSSRGWLRDLGRLLCYRWLLLNLHRWLARLLLLLLLRWLLLWRWLLRLLSLRFAVASREPPLHELQRFPAFPASSRSARHD